MPQLECFEHFSLIALDFLTRTEKIFSLWMNDGAAEWHHHWLFWRAQNTFEWLVMSSARLHAEVIYIFGWNFELVSGIILIYFSLRDLSYFCYFLLNFSRFLINLKKFMLRYFFDIHEDIKILLWMFDKNRYQTTLPSLKAQ